MPLVSLLRHAPSLAFRNGSPRRRRRGVRALLSSRRGQKKEKKRRERRECFCSRERGEHELLSIFKRPFALFIRSRSPNSPPSAHSHSSPTGRRLQARGQALVPRGEQLRAAGRKEGLRFSFFFFFFDDDDRRMQQLKNALLSVPHRPLRRTRALPLVTRSACPEPLEDGRPGALLHSKWRERGGETDEVLTHLPLTFALSLQKKMFFSVAARLDRRRQGLSHRGPRRRRRSC